MLIYRNLIPKKHNSFSRGFIKLYNNFSRQIVCSSTEGKKVSELTIPHIFQVKILLKPEKTPHIFVTVQKVKADDDVMTHLKVPEKLHVCPCSSSLLVLSETVCHHLKFYFNLFACKLMTLYKYLKMKDSLPNFFRAKRYNK